MKVTIINNTNKNNQKKIDAQGQEIPNYLVSQMKIKKNHYNRSNFYEYILNFRDIQNEKKSIRCSLFDKCKHLIKSYSDIEITLEISKDFQSKIDLYYENIYFFIKPFFELSVINERSKKFFTKYEDNQDAYLSSIKTFFIVKQTIDISTFKVPEQAETLIILACEIINQSNNFTESLLQSVNLKTLIVLKSQNFVSFELNKFTNKFSLLIIDNHSISNFDFIEFLYYDETNAETSIIFNEGVMEAAYLQKINFSEFFVYSIKELMIRNISIDYLNYDKNKGNEKSVNSFSFFQNIINSDYLNRLNILKLDNCYFSDYNNANLFYLDEIFPSIRNLEINGGIIQKSSHKPNFDKIMASNCINMQLLFTRTCEINFLKFSGCSILFNYSEHRGDYKDGPYFESYLTGVKRIILNDCKISNLEELIEFIIDTKDGKHNEIEILGHSNPSDIKYLHEKDIEINYKDNVFLESSLKDIIKEYKK